MNEKIALLSTLSYLCQTINMHFTSQIGTTSYNTERHDDESFLSNNITLLDTCVKSVNCKSYIASFHNFSSELLLLLYVLQVFPTRGIVLYLHLYDQVHHFPGFSEVSFTLLQQRNQSYYAHMYILCIGFY